MGKSQENHWKMEVYPLVNVYVTMERSTMLLMGKSTVSTEPFSSSHTA